MPTGVFERPLSLEERFWARVEKRGPDECWPPSVNNIWRDDDTVKMPFASWEINVGHIPDGFGPKRTCTTEYCCNPRHMILQPRISSKGTIYPSRRSITHCKHGHEYTPETTQVRPNGTRRCKTCVRDRAAEFDKMHADRRREQHKRAYRFRRALITGEDIQCPQ